MPASVTLEPVAPHHADAVQRLAAHPDVVATTNLPEPYPDDGAAQWIAYVQTRHAVGEEFVFAIMNEDSELVGVTGLVDVTATEAELGFWVGVPYWGRGYATAAARCRSWAASSSRPRRTSIRSGPTPTSSHAIASTAAPGARPADEFRHRLIAARARLVALEVVLTRRRRYLERREVELGTRRSGATIFAYPERSHAHASAHSDWHAAPAPGGPRSVARRGEIHPHPAKETRRPVAHHP